MLLSLAICKDNRAMQWININAKVLMKMMLEMTLCLHYLRI